MDVKADPLLRRTRPVCFSMTGSDKSDKRLPHKETLIKLATG
jgi:hypothetical protein